MFGGPHTKGTFVLRTRWVALLPLTVALALASPVAASASEATGQITGTVTSASTKTAVAGIEICAAESVFEVELFGHCTKTNSGGEYSITSVPVGKYGVGFFAPEGSGLDYITQYYNGKGSVFESELVAVEAGKTATGINAAMVVGGQIAGKVTGAVSKAAIAGVQVCAIRELGEFGEQCAKTNSSGEYTVSGLASGTYKVHFFSPEVSGLNYLSQYYNGKSSFADAIGVPVSAPGSATGIDAAMIVGGRITGKVTSAASKAAIAGIQVCAFTEGTEFVGRCTKSGPSGEYSIVALPTGAYKVYFSSPEGSGLDYLSQYYNGSSSFAEAQVVAVSAGVTKTAIDAAMAPGGTISGTVTSASSKAALEGIRVCASQNGKGVIVCATSSSSGGYLIPALPGGQYTVSFNPNGQNYIIQYYKGKESFGEASAVSVTAGSPTPGINAAMVAGGQITGRVANTSTKAALGGIEVCLQTTSGGFYGQCATTNFGGEYTIGGLATGEYKIEFYGGANYVTQYYDAQSSVSEANAVSVTAGATTPAIDAAMVVGGHITGTVTSAATKAGLASIQVCATPIGGGNGSCTSTTSAGEYTIGGLATGEYTVSFYPFVWANYLQQYYDGRESFAEANSVSVTAGSTTSGINAAMVEGGSITGKVTNSANKAALGGIQVCPLTTSGAYGGQCTATNSAGEYTIVGLATGEYKIRFFSNTGAYFTQYYNGKSSSTEAAVLAVAAASKTSGIDAALVEGGKITGKVTSAATKAGIEGVQVCAESKGLFGQCAQTNAVGEYTIIGLATGEYSVKFEPNGGNFLPQYYNGKSSASEANPASVADSTTTFGINAALAVGGQVTGKVTSAATKAGIEDIEVCASRMSEGEGGGGCAITSVTGEYNIEGLSTGKYSVRFSPLYESGLNYLAQYYSGKSSLAEASSVSVTAGSTTSSIDAAMAVGGQITGKVTDAVSKAAIKGIQVCASPTGGGEGAGCTATGTGGEYTIAGLATGEYKVEFSGGGLQYAEQFYDGKSSFSEATPVSVVAGLTKSAVNATMLAKGQITGKVTSASSKAALSGIQVCPLSTSGQFDGSCVTTNASGEYTIIGLATGEYKVQFSVPFFGSALNYLPQYYNGKSSLAEAGAVAVSAGAVASAVNAEMQAGGEITGKVTSASSKAALRGIEVCPQGAGGSSSGQCATSNASGEYKLVALATGEYKVEFYSNSGANYVPQYYNTKASYTEANAVSVTAGSTTPAINAAMVLGGTITGKVTDASTNAAVSGIQVCPQTISGASSGSCATTNSNGEYKLIALATGEYKVEFSVPYGSALNYLPQYYNSKESSGEANPVVVTVGATTSEINAAMVAGGKITGKVTDAVSKVGLFGADVCLEAPKSIFFGNCVLTNVSGEYTFTGLASGEYKVEFESFSGGYSTQYYSNKGSASEADPVSVTTGATASGIDAALVVGGRITGTVTSAATKAGIGGVQVCATSVGKEPFTRCASTSPSGEYTITGLATGEYKIEFSPISENYLRQYYNGKESSLEASPVSVTSGATTSAINAALAVGGEITGKVTDASTKAALGGITVCPLTTSAGFIGQCAASNSSGEYTIVGLATGEYKIEFYPSSGANYAPQFYNGKSSHAEASPVSVTAGATTAGINAAMVVGGQITGRVTNASTKSAVSGINVCPRATSGEVFFFFNQCATTNSSGEYTIVGLTTGEYKVEFNAEGQNYLTQFYNGQPSFSGATVVSASAGSTKTGVDAALIVGGEITGKVSEAASKAAIAGIQVCSSPVEDSGFFNQCATTNSSGEYTIVALVTGQYDVRFTSPSNGYATQYYNTKTSLTFANAVSVTTGSPTGAIDAELANLPVSIKAPIITGTPQQAHTLTEAHGSWKNSPTEYGYQWERCNSTGGECAAIAGATEQTYALLQADVAHTLRVTETATNLAGSSSPAVSAATPVVLPLPPVNTQLPAISGAAQQGKTLAEAHGIWENNPTEFAYQWERCNSTGGECVAIPGATKQTYVPVAADVTHKLVVAETASNAGGASSPAASEASAVVVPPVPVNKTAPSFSGSAVQGQTLSEAHGTWENSPTEFTYQWERCDAAGGECAAITGAEEQTYLLLTADVGHTIRVREVATNAGGSGAPAVSAASVKVAAAVPVRIQAPSISGTAQQGKMLTEIHGSWSNEPTSYTYQWLRCEGEGKNCTAISGAQEQIYVLVAGDVSHTIEVTETAKNAAGEGSPASSSSTGAVLPAVPVNTNAATITGSAVQSQTLSEVHGSWENNPTEYSYQWLRCNGTGGECAEISGASERTYLLTSADVSHTLEVKETASNAGGAGAPAVSAKTAIVAAAKPLSVTAPSISGHAQQGETLTESHGTWTNEPTEYKYQWLRCDGEGKSCVAISGASEQTYLLISADVAHTVEVKETASNAAGPSSPASSLVSAVVLPPVPVNISTPKISGTVQQGRALTETRGSWTNSPTGYEVQWLQCNSLGAGCLPISGATEQTYVPVAADVGHPLAVEEVAINAGGRGIPVVSTATAVVLSSVPVNVTPPSISGTAEKGQTLVEQHGTWTNEPIGFTYEWLQCSKEGTECKAIASAVDQTYLATAVDVGHTLIVNEVASNGGGQSAPAASAPSGHVQLAPLHAVAGENVSTTAGVSVSFDGSGSTPASEIEKYRWEFGDGSEAEGQSVSHAYAAEGIYTAKLTISRGVENTNASVTVTVAPAPTHTARIEVTDSGHSPLSGATVLYIGPGNLRIQAVTGGDGKASLPGLPNGSDTVYAYRSGFQPAAGQVTVSGGDGEATVALSSGEIATSTLKSHEMTLKEIEAAGINPNDPANQNVYEFEVRLAFIESPQAPVEFHCYINSHGEFVGGCTGGGGGGGWGGGGGGPSCSPHECVGGGIVAVPGVVEGKPLIQWLILRGKASVLKQFFAVSEVVQNLSSEPFKLAAGIATLNVPPGMSLAPTATPQSATQSVALISGHGSAETNWIVRGDKPGEYFLSANYHSKLEPFGAPVDLEARLASPLKVWGVEALSLTVQADEGFLVEGRPYHVHIGVTNKANIPLYNVGAEIELNVHERFIFQPDQEASHTISELKPGETVYAPEDILVPDAASEAAFNPALSSAHFVGEEIKPGVGIEAVAPPPLYGISAPTDTPNMVHLHWQSVPGAEGYEVFPTTDLDTPFAEGAESVLSSSSSEAGVTELPGTATNAYIFGSSKEKPKYYAVSALINGIPILEFPVIPATAGAEPPASSGEGGSGSGGVLSNNESSPGSENGMGTPAPTCPKHMITLSGGITVEASCFHVSGNAATATGHVRVNGLDIVASGSVTLNTSTLELDSSGQVDVYAGSLHIYHGALSWKFTAQLSLKAPGNLKIKGLPVGGEITVSLVPGGVHAVANATIGTATFEVSGQIDLELTLKDGLKLNSFALELASDVPIKSLVVKKAKLAYHHTSAGDVWDGVVAVELPAKGPTVQGELVLTNGSVSEVALNVSGINKPIGEVVFLQSLGLKVDFIPRLSATGSIGLSAGPKILGHTAASLDGSLTATIGDPFVLEAAGTLDMIDQKVASAWVKATIPGGVSFSGEISRSFAVIEITGGISGSITPHNFEAQGHVKIDAHVVSASGDALVNNTGLAGCASAQVLWATVSIGASHRWSGENSVFADTCGFGRLQSALGASSSALPGPPSIVHVPAHTRQINLVVHGTTGSPEVSLMQGKNNVLIMPNTTGAFGRAVYVALADPSIDTTYIAIAGPEAGTLHVASPAGQPRFASVGSALPLPSPHVQVAVHSVGTRRYRLSWSSRKIPGQTLLFQDVNARGQVQVLSTTRSDGRITFTALDNGANGPQKLRVVVDQDGLTREVLAGPVFHPAPVHVGKPHVNMRLKGRAAVITWSAAQNATSYEVSVSTSDGRHLFFAVGARDRSVRIPGASRVAASVRGVGAGMELGPLGVGKTTSQKPTPKNHARSKKV